MSLDATPSVPPGVVSRGIGVALQARVPWAMHHVEAPAATLELTNESPFRTLVREALGMVAAVGLLVVLVFCAQTAWQVLQVLGQVKLSDATHALSVISVRDAVLCVVGYRIAMRLVQVFIRNRRGQ
ncbi:MAG: hypothetical protein E6J71_28165 [Deltaproteobacteria bacterium]|nr:MAG: hypothetical protein E6J71_28165 [Deltaproteobacteria bacterium]